MKFLHDEIKLIHTDLKPENILFVNTEQIILTDVTKAPINVSKKVNSKDGFRYLSPQCFKVKIIDFGGAIYYHEAHEGLINTRQYRSPEVILGSCKWNEKTDVWSLACIFSELYSGELLFPTHSDKEHLALIQKCTGKPKVNFKSNIIQQGWSSSPV